MLDHMMAAVEDITGYKGNHTLRDKWVAYTVNIDLEAENSCPLSLH